MEYFLKKLTLILVTLLNANNWPKDRLCLGNRFLPWIPVVLLFMHRDVRLSIRLFKTLLALLATVAAMYPNDYSTLFRKQFEHPPIEYFNRLKVQRACELL